MHIDEQGVANSIELDRFTDWRLDDLRMPLHFDCMPSDFAEAIELPNGLGDPGRGGSLG
jgi:hypothetical protein